MTTNEDLNQQQKSQGNGPTSVIDLPEPGSTETQAPAYRAWRSNVVTAWLLAQRPSDLTRACLRGIIPRLDPVIADRLFTTVAEQLAAIALLQVQEAEQQLKAEEALSQQLAAEVDGRRCRERSGVRRCYRDFGHEGTHTYWSEDIPNPHGMPGPDA